MKKKLTRRKPHLSLAFRLIRGAIGKDYVIKHYSYGAIRTKYPDMRKIIPSRKQVRCRNLFKEAVDYANQIMLDPALKMEWRKRIKSTHRVFNAIIKYYMQKVKMRRSDDMARTERLLKKSFLIGRPEPGNEQFKIQIKYANRMTESYEIYPGEFPPYNRVLNSG